MRMPGWIMLLALLCSACGPDDEVSTIFGSSSGPATLGTTLDSGPDDGSATGDDTMPTTDPSTTDPSTGDGDGDGDGDPGDGDGDGDGDPGNPCGNGSIDPGEQCDGANLAGTSCVDLGYTGGTLACDPSVCVFDTSGCTSGGGNMCDAFCNGCTCPSNECTMCCALKGQVDACSGGMCGCF